MWIPDCRMETMGSREEKSPKGPRKERRIRRRSRKKAPTISII